MFSNTQRLLFADQNLVYRPYADAVYPDIMDADFLHNNLVCSFDELFTSFQTHKTIKEFGEAVHISYLYDLTLKFSRIAENYRDALQKLHDTTLQALKDACLAVAKEIDEEAKSRFALGDDCPHAKAAENATRRHVFGYNEKARLKRDYELREDFRLRLSRAKKPEAETMVETLTVLDPLPTNLAPHSPPTELTPLRLRSSKVKSSYLGCSRTRNHSPAEKQSVEPVVLHVSC